MHFMGLMAGVERGGGKQVEKNSMFVSGWRTTEGGAANATMISGFYHNCLLGEVECEHALALASALAQKLLPKAFAKHLAWFQGQDPAGIFPNPFTGLSRTSDYSNRFHLDVLDALLSMIFYGQDSLSSSTGNGYFAVASLGLQVQIQGDMFLFVRTDTLLHG